MHSAIQLIHHKLLKIDLSAQEFEGDETNYKIEHALIILPTTQDNGIWHARLDLRILNETEDKQAPYLGELSIIGHFKLDEGFPAEKADAMLRLNTGAILYGALRELVLAITSRSIHGELVLPTIDARSFLEKDDNPA